MGKVKRSHFGHSPDCRAQLAPWMVGFHFAECLTNDPLCPHRLKCCEYHLCFHPARHKFMAQTPKPLIQSAIVNPPSAIPTAPAVSAR